MTSAQSTAASHSPLLEAFEAALSAHLTTFASFPEPLSSACRYVLSTGGKRVRPILCLSAAEACGLDPLLAMPAALALEFIHTYSLVHDDLPSMDDDDERRGRPTCHKVYGEAHAILTGDALLTEAFVVLAASGAPRSVIELIGRAAGGTGMVGGQVQDIDEAPLDGLSGLEAMHALKTGALLRAAALAGGLSVGADPSMLSALDAYGTEMGLLFQLTDDLLDAKQDAAAGNRSYLQFASPEALSGRAADVCARAHAAARLLPRPEALTALATAVLDRDR
ncbi:MAG: polyprenyl synthetase family protein [Myxococcales bacterium]|nr:polyprenyl synthetase family protein [Myxococcales bacterium]